MFGCATTTTSPTGASRTAVATEELVQSTLVVRAYKTDAARLYRLAYPIYQSATEICRADKVGPSLGLIGVSSLDVVPKNYRAAAQSELGLSQHVTVIFLPETSAAAKAGLKVGDQITAVGKTVIPTGTKGLTALAKASQSIQTSETTVSISVLRSNEVKIISVNPETMPRIGLNYDVFSPVVNAFADGTTINFTRGLVRAMGSDQTINMVVAHELAHNCQGHLEAKRTNAMGGLVLDLLAASAGVDTQGLFTKTAGNAFSADFEREADYVGLYYLARAGLAVSEARDAYRLLTVETGAELQAGYGSTHPANPERFVRMEATEKEIASKAAAHQPLVPERKK